MASDSLSEQEVQFRKRARRRLIGAIALVLLMVTLLPMVLDDQEPAVPQQEIAITIPSQDGADFTSKIVPAPTTETTPPAETPAVPMASPIEPPPPSAPVAAAAETAAVLKAEPAAELPKPVVPVEVKPAPEPAKIEPAKGEPTSAESATTKAPEPVATGKAGFSVQIGVYSDPVKVKQLQSKLKAQGVASYTEKLGTKIRLRSGPYPTRAAAEKVQAKLKQMNMTSMVVTNK